MHYWRLRQHGDTSYEKQAIERGECAVEGCTAQRAVGRKGWCNPHYQRWRKHGDPTAGDPPKGHNHHRRGPYFGCWEWGGPTNENGYGTANVKGYSSSLVHRIVFEAIYGWVPDLLRHRCDNPLCYRPDHLLPGDHKSNARDMVERGRSCRGTDHPCAKLELSQVLEILAKPWAWGSAGALAKKFGVSVSTVSAIRQGRQWAWVKPPPD